MAYASATPRIAADPSDLGVAFRDRVGLLVSVRDAAEAVDAIAGGADVIDVKEPSRGPMGAANTSTIGDVVATVAGRRPVTAAWGELSEADPTPAFPGVAVLKLGLAGMAGERWEAKLIAAAERASHVVAPVAYADHDAARSPPIDQVLRGAIAIGAPWVVIDTFDKSGPGLIEAIDPAELASAVEQAARHGLRAVLAGRLADEAIDAAAALDPALIGVRGAVCHGGRAGQIDRALVAKVRARVACPRQAV
ncbi:MAG: (5-formylfuran-3-yl)methyl phosphate synthase [Planctomycetota bacterium]